MSSVWAGLYLFLLLACLGLHVFSLPGNWLLLGLVVLWDVLHPMLHLGWGFYALLLGAALAGEAVELAVQLLGARRYGASGQGNLGGLLGAFAGALLGAPFLFGLGALFGALLGAFLGCYIFERVHGKDEAAARRAAMGAMYGKVLGFTAKIGCGVVMWLAAARKLWPA